MKQSIFKDVITCYGEVMEWGIFVLGTDYDAIISPFLTWPKMSLSCFLFGKCASDHYCKVFWEISGCFYLL